MTGDVKYQGNPKVTLLEVQWGGKNVVLNRMDTVDFFFFEKVTFEQNLEGGESLLCGYLGKEYSMWREQLCKGPEVGVCLWCSRNGQEPREPRVEGGKSGKQDLR